MVAVLPGLELLTCLMFSELRVKGVVLRLIGDIEGSIKAMKVACKDNMGFRAWGLRGCSGTYYPNN